jgi:hypothetical protein
MKIDAGNSPKEILCRPVPSRIVIVVSLVSIALFITFVWGVCFPPKPHIAPAYRDPEVARQASLIRPDSALGRNMRRVDAYYYVVAKEGEHFTVIYLNAQGKKVRVADAIATEVAGSDEKGAEVRSSDGILLKRWQVSVRVNAGSLLFVSAHSKRKNSSLEVSIRVDAFDACRATEKPGQEAVSCRYKMSK